MKYNWNEETVEDCIPEDGETEEDLANDLIETVYK